MTDAQPSPCPPRLYPTGTNSLCLPPRHLLWAREEPQVQGQAVHVPASNTPRPTALALRPAQVCPSPPAGRVALPQIPAPAPFRAKATDNVCVAPTFSCVLHFLLPLVLFLRVRVLVHCSFPNSISFLLAVPQISQFPRQNTQTARQT